jgi:formylglycine-generating enzyme required for sulfatase activity
MFSPRVLVVAILCALTSVSTRSQERTLPRAGTALQEASDLLALLRSREDDQTWRLLRASTDNTRRSYVIHLLGRNGIDSSRVIARLHAETDVSARRALILALGSYTSAQISEAQRQNLTGTLLRWYRDDPDAGIHGAVDWLLRHGRRGQTPRAVDWGQAPALMGIDRELGGQSPGKRQWYANREGQTFVIVRGPVEFQMGAAPGELARRPAPDSAEEPQHTVRIPRSFAIAAKEVTVEEFQRFLDANPDVRRRHVYPDNPDRMAQVLARMSPDPDSPRIAVTWYEAAMYCNWLSRRDGLPQSEWVYPVSFEQFKDAMELPPDYLQRRGYRLPTEAEWEFAARAGSTTPRFYGNGDELLEEYAWYSKNPPRSRSDSPDPADPQRTWPVGQVKPNDFGLFDVYGNVWEWTQSRMRTFEPGSVRDDIEDDVRRITDALALVRRGGSFSYEAAMMRSAHRGPITAFPTNRRDTVGFRVARTYR